MPGSAAGGALASCTVIASGSRRCRLAGGAGVPASTADSSDMPTKNGRGGGSVMISTIEISCTSSRLPTSSSSVREKIDQDCQ